MNPLESIKQGILTGDWDLVCHGYKRMTGEELSEPGRHWAEEYLTQIANLIADAGPPAIDAEIMTKPKKKVGRPKSNVKKKKAAKREQQSEDGDDASITLNDKDKTTVQKQVGGSRLITNEPDPEEVKRNIAKAKAARTNKLRLDRKANKKCKAKCSECEETFDSDRPTGEMGQKCPKCLKEKLNRFK